MEDHGKPRAITGDDGRLRETLIYRRTYVEVKHGLDNQKAKWMDDNGVRMHTHMHTWQHVDMHIRNTCTAGCLHVHAHPFMYAPTELITSNDFQLDRAAVKAESGSAKASSGRALEHRQLHTRVP